MLLPLFRRKNYNFTNISLTTKRLILRAPLERDQSDWISLRNQNRDYLEIWEPAWVKRPLTSKDYVSFIKRRQKQWQKDQGYSFLLFQKDNNTLIGNININNIVRGVAQFASVGYWVGQKHARKGYMTEALKTTLHYAFDDLKLHKITASCLPENTASITVLEKLNFIQEGYARKHLKIAGKWQDHLIYGIIAEDLTNPPSITLGSG